MRDIRQRDDDTTWMKSAACKGQTHLFFPVGNDDRSAETDRATAEARLICSGCPVREPCLEYAVRWKEPCGVWGGQSTQQRLGKRGRGRPPGAANKVPMSPGVGQVE